jgi:hypothetical protein
MQQFDRRSSRAWSIAIKGHTHTYTEGEREPRFCRMQVFIETLPYAGELSSFCKQDASKREFSPEMRSILEVIAATGQYWHNWEQLKTLLSFCLKQVLQDYYGSHVDAAIGPPRPLITGETFQQLQDRLDSGI